jgi:diguanylate cyclase (GGDEF)-like protein
MNEKQTLENIFEKLTSEEKEVILQLIAIDPITQISNRNGFERSLATNISGAIRKEEYVTLLIIDTDNFKKYNDTKGHPEGDKLLYNLAQTMKKTLRSEEQYLLHRIGGDEFAVILPNAKTDAGYSLGERLRKNIEDNFKASCDVTVSIGVASIKPEFRDDTKADANRLYKKADDALYFVKKAGRNGVAAASSEISPLT